MTMNQDDINADIIDILAQAFSTTSPPETVTAKLARLQAHSAAQQGAVDPAASMARRKAEAARLENLKGPKRGNGVLFDAPAGVPDSVARADELERAKRPAQLPPRGAA